MLIVLKKTSAVTLIFLLIGALAYADELAGSSGEGVASFPTPPKGSVERAEAQRVCRELPMGESQVISESRGQSLSGAVRRYKLTRSAVSTNLFIAELNINFLLSRDRADQLYRGCGPGDLHGQDTVLQAQNDEQRAAFIGRARQCFHSMDGRIKSPDGTQLNLRLGGYDTRAPVNGVSIDVSEARSSSTGWAGRVDCETIVHEVMHLMGLVDGYRETSRRVEPRMQAKHLPLPEGVAPSTFMYDCRRLEPNTSVMHRQEIALGLRYDVIFCDPQAGEQGGRRVESSPTRCLDGSSPLHSFSDLSREGFERKVQRHTIAGVLPISKGSERTASYSGATYLYHVHRPHSFPLTNEQMAFITKPGCVRASASYTNCARNAYRTRSLEGCLPGCD